MLKNIITCIHRGLKGWRCALTYISFRLQQLSHCTCISMKYMYTQIVSHVYAILRNITLRIGITVAHRKRVADLGTVALNYT